MKATDEIALFCTAEVMKAYLPMTRYLFEDHWLVSARTRLTFALVYLGSNQPLVLSLSQKAIPPQISISPLMLLLSWGGPIHLKKAI